MQLTKTVSILKAELQQISHQQRSTDDEITKKEEEIIALKVGIASIEESLKLEDEEVIRHLISKHMSNLHFLLNGLILPNHWH